MAGIYLKQSTASQSRAIGPFIDDTDFKTVETGLTIANTDIDLVVNGGASANKNSGGGTHRANGVYGVTFDATDTATVGEMHVSVVVSGALPVFHTFFVLEEAVYDAMFSASAPGPAKVSDLGTVQTADHTAAIAAIPTTMRGTDNAATATALATVDSNVDAILVDTGTTLPNQITGLNDFNPASDTVARVTLVDTTTVNTDMRGTDGANTTAPNTVVPDEAGTAAALHATTDGLITTVDTVVDALPTLAEILAGGNVDGYTLEETLKLCLAGLAGKLSGAATATITIRAADDSKDRITATVDADGNRSAVTLDAAG